MIPFIFNIVYLFAVEILPGVILAQFFKGRLRNNLFFCLFLSFLLWPFLYLFLAYINRLSGSNWLLLTVGLFFLARSFSRKYSASLIDLDSVFPKLKTDEKKDRWLKWAPGILITVFFLLVLAGKIGLLSGNIPVGDDQPRLQKATSIALSPQTPIFYNFPISNMTIYYFNNIPSGLITKFTENEIKVNQSWFLHNVVTTLVMLWLIVLLATSLFSTYLERFVLIFSLTFGSGLEFFLAKYKGVKVMHLEWWTDWIGLNPMIHTQISAFFTLFFWVSQHLFGGLLSIPLYFLITSDQRSKKLTQIFIGLIFANLVGYTVFVFLNIIIIYILFLAIRWVQKKEKLTTLIKENLVIGGAGFLLALPMILLYLGAQKGHYFVVFSNVFWFFNNNHSISKLANFALTIPIYFFVEFGALFITFIVGFYLVIRKKVYRSNLLYWLLFLYLPIWVIFFVKALDDNNISMRSLIPSQIALGVISAWVVGQWRQKWPKFTSLSFLVAVVLLITALPTTLFEAYHRFLPSLDKQDPIYSLIDEKLPLNSIIFEDSTQNTDFVSVLGHRFTFKPLSEFTVTDYEYVAVGKISPLLFDKPNLYVWLKVLEAHPELKTNYHLYRLTDKIRSKGYSNAIFSSDKLTLSPLEFPR